MRKFLPILLLAAVLMSSVSCIDDRKKEPELVSGEVEFLSQRGRWTYISLENGTVVGSSFLGDESYQSFYVIVFRGIRVVHYNIFRIINFSCF